MRQRTPVTSASRIQSNLLIYDCALSLTNNNNIVVEIYNNSACGNMTVSLTRNNRSCSNYNNNNARRCNTVIAYMILASSQVVSVLEALSQIDPCHTAQTMR